MVWTFLEMQSPPIVQSVNSESLPRGVGGPWAAAATATFSIRLHFVGSSLLFVPLPHAAVAAERDGLLFWHHITDSKGRRLTGVHSRRVNFPRRKKSFETMPSSPDLVFTLQGSSSRGCQVKLAAKKVPDQCRRSEALHIFALKISAVCFWRSDVVWHQQQRFSFQYHASISPSFVHPNCFAWGKKSSSLGQQHLSLFVWNGIFGGLNDIRVERGGDKNFDKCLPLR